MYVDIYDKQKVNQYGVLRSTDVLTSEIWNHMVTRTRFMDTGSIDIIMRVCMKNSQQKCL